MKKYKKIILIIYVVLIVSFGLCFAFKSVKREMRTDIAIMTETRIFDNADLFTDEEESKLNKQLKDVMKSEKTDVVIATINDSKGKNAMDYSEEFYKSSGFGYDKEKGTGVLLLIDMDTSVTGKRRIQISGFGDAKNYIDNDLATKMSNDIKDYCSDGEYFEAASKFLDEAEVNMNQSPSIPGFMKNSLWLLLISAAGTAIVVLIKVRAFGRKVTTTSSTYLQGRGVKVRSKKDTFLGKTVTTRVIQHDDSNGGGSSSGGGGSDFSSGGADF